MKVCNGRQDARRFGREGAAADHGHPTEVRGGNEGEPTEYVPGSWKKRAVKGRRDFHGSARACEEKVCARGMQCGERRECEGACQRRGQYKGTQWTHVSRLCGGQILMAEEQEEVATTVSRWKERRFRDSDLPLQTAVSSLYTAHPLVEALRTAPTEWTVSRHKGNAPCR